MPEADGEPASQVPLPPDRFGDPEPPATPAELYGRPAPPPERVEAEPVGSPPVAVPAEAGPTTRSRPGALGRLISVIVSVGLAWALVVAITAWLLGLFLTRG
jgi:hypothetical protein